MGRNPAERYLGYLQLFRKKKVRFPGPSATVFVYCKQPQLEV